MKSQVVAAEQCILVDDSIKNLDNWGNAQEIPIYFGNQICEYPTVESLDDVLSERVLKLERTQKFVQKQSKT